MKCFKNVLQESKQALKQKSGVRIQDIHHQGIHLLHEIHRHVHIRINNTREWIKGETQSNDQI